MENSIIRSLKIQARVIGALLLREVITRYGRHGIGILWLVVEPMLFTLGITTIWYFGKLHKVTNIPIVAFSVTGYSTLLLWRAAANRCSKAIEPNLTLMYHRNVKVLDLFITRVLLELAGGTASFLVIVMSFTAIGLMKLPLDIMTVIWAWLLLAWLAMGLGFVVGALSERSDTFERMWHVAQYLLFPLSGAVYMVDWLPHNLQAFVLWMPMVHGAEMIRHGFFGNVVVTHENPAYFAFVNLLLTLIGLALVRDLGKRVQPE